MKIDLSTVIIGLDKKPVKTDGAGSPELTLSVVCCNVLLTPDQEEQGIPGTEKVQRFKLAEKCYDDGEQDLSADDIVLLKRLIAKFYGPLIVGRAYEILEPKE